MARACEPFIQPCNMAVLQLRYPLMNGVPCRSGTKSYACWRSLLPWPDPDQLYPRARARAREQA